ncbi:OprO/OprP family phosphate-selective porin [Flavihumibacter rivuli]|uniref:porin n=1 Tax=Flavihumibacter rivuli TaxID=2838156 RepID=UPI001BDE1F96|nr:porin [Flavihumibacter rivuli]ULQ56353.1 OprO/OprP family phosphate-selective porin [Flavihumibacter rivuli]
MKLTLDSGWLAKMAIILSVALFQSYTAGAQDTLKTAKPQPPKKWYETFSIRGYAQVRYNRLLETNPKLKCEQCDRSWGENGGFFLRRIRVIISGNISDRVYLYIQPDFASSASTTGLHFGQIRDAYFDVAFDKKKEFRVRLGQSKVPFGFENMQSSQNRLPLDRNDALNSPLSNERDLGAFLYWAPAEKRELLASLVSDGLKGSGDYGIVGFGLYNGQTANRPELNNSPHVVGRFTWPTKLKNGQIIEAGIQAYTGKYVVSDTSRGVKVVNPNGSYKDERVGLTFVLYPQPFGIQAEYNWGTGPEYDPATNSIRQTGLNGGYILASYMLKPGNHVLIPFSRFQYYDGGKKHELDTRSYGVKEFELGVEWQVNRNFEFVAMYTISDRRFEDGRTPVNHQNGRLLRLQAQVNF